MMFHEATVSVILVTYSRNVEIIDRGLKSVINQTHPPDEIIIVDSSGSKERKRILSSFFAKYDDNIQLVFMKDGCNASVARNYGASLAKSDYLCFLDDDDEWYSCKLSEQLASAPAVLIASPYYVGNEDKTFFPLNSDFSKYSILSKNVIGSTSFPMVRKDVFIEEEGFDESFQSNQEWDLWIRISIKHGFTCTKSVVGLKNVIDDSISKNVEKRVSGGFSLFRKHIFTMLKHPEYSYKAAYNFFMEMITYKRFSSSFVGFMFYGILSLFSIYGKLFRKR